MDSQEITRLSRLKPLLRLIVGGLLILAVDIPLSGVDVAHDLTGALLILWASARALYISIGTPALTAMAAATAAAAITLAEVAARDLFGLVPPLPITQLLGILASLGAAAFCLGMRDLCDPARAWSVARSWQRTAILIAAIYGGIGAISLAVRLATGPAGNARTPGAGSIPVILLFLSLLLLPAVHFLISTARTLIATGGPHHPCRRCGHDRKSLPESAPCPFCDCPGHCRACGYELSGLTSIDRCPECGATLDQNESPRPLDRGPVATSLS